MSSISELPKRETLKRDGMKKLRLKSEATIWIDKVFVIEYSQ